MEKLFAIGEIELMFPEQYLHINRVVHEKNVFLAENNTNKHILKIIDKKAFNQEKYDQLCELDHSGIAKLYSYHVFDDYVVIKRQFIEGRTLNEVVEQDGVFPEDQIKSILTKLSIALEYLHTKESIIIYRDLHPKNIIITETGEAILIDIESSRIYRENSSQDTEIIGVIGFIAPEQYGFDQSSIQSDIYSLGIIGAYMLTGRYPTFNNNRVQIKESDSSYELRVTILKMVEFSKEKRPKSMKRVRYLLNKEQKSSPIWLLVPVAIIVLLIVLSRFYNPLNSDNTEIKGDLEDVMPISDELTDDETEEQEILEGETEEQDISSDESNIEATNNEHQDSGSNQVEITDEATDLDIEDVESDDDDNLIENADTEEMITEETNTEDSDLEQIEVDEVSFDEETNEGELLFESYESEMFPLLEDTVIISAFEANWIPVYYGRNDESNVVTMIEMAYFADAQYLYLRYIYESLESLNTTLFLQVDNASGVFAKYRRATEEGVNDVVIRIDKTSLSESIGSNVGQIEGIGYDIGEEYKQLVLISFNDIDF